MHVLFLLACDATPVETNEPAPLPEPLAWTDLSDEVERQRADARVPALAAATVGPDGIEAFGIAGLRQAGGDEGITWDDPFHLGSLTKSMTGTLAARMVEAGTVQWDTPIETVWPHAHPDWHGVTLVQLLKHQSGSAANPTQAQFIELETRSNDTLAARAWFAEQWLAVPPATPRDTFTYSNAGIMIAGAMLESLDGRNWEDAITEDLFAPLGMDRCGFGAPKGAAPWGHLGTEPVNPNLPGADNPRPLGPAGIVHCPMVDYSRYIQAHLTRDPALLTEASWDVLHTPAEGDYAAGWFLLNQPWSNGDILFHNGSNLRWLAHAWIAPGIDRAFIVMTNRADANAEDALQEMTLALIDRE